MSERRLSEEMTISFYNMAWLVDRFARSWGQKVRRLKEKIEEERPDEVDHIYNEVKDQANRITIKREEPDEATIEIYGVRIKKKIVHGKSEQNNGADIYLDVEGHKFALVQFKLQNNGRFLFDQTQIGNLSKLCGYCEQEKDRPLLCPSFIWLIDDSYTYYKHRILKLCQVKNILGTRNSASLEEFDGHGITRRAFKELLAKCWVGAPYKRKPSTQELLDYSQLTKRLVVAFNIRRIG